MIRIWLFIPWLASILALAHPIMAQDTDLIEARAYSAAEVQLLQELDQKRVELERRAQALALREQLLNLAEERLAARLQDMRDLKDELSTMLGDLSEMKKEELAQLAQIYGNMKPNEAAGILNRLDNSIVYDVLKRMQAKKSAKIMAAMDGNKARFISELMAQEQQLPAFLRQQKDEN